MKQQNITYQSQTGFTLIEIGAVIIIGSILVILAVGVIRPMLTAAKAQNMYTDLQLLQQNIRSDYNGQSDGYSSVSNEEIIKAKSYPSVWSTNGSKLFTSYAGEVVVSADSNEVFTINFAKVQSDLCQKIIPQLVQSNAFIKIDINDSQLWADGAVMPKKSDITSACMATNTVPIKISSN